jgi:hypothetical protein
MYKKIQKNIPPSTLILGSNFRGWQSGLRFADASVEKVFSCKTSSLGSTNRSALPKRFPSSFGNASSSSKQILKLIYLEICNKNFVMGKKAKK